MDANTQAVETAQDATHDANAPQHSAKALERSTDKVLLELKAVVDNAHALLKEAVDASAERVAGEPTYLDDRLDAVKDSLRHMKGATAARAKNATLATEHYVRENPWRSIGFAVAASVVISFLVVRAGLPALGKMRGPGKL